MGNQTLIDGTIYSISGGAAAGYIPKPKEFTDLINTTWLIDENLIDAIKKILTYYEVSVDINWLGIDSYAFKDTVKIRFGSYYGSDHQWYADFDVYRNDGYYQQWIHGDIPQVSFPFYAHFSGGDTTNANLIRLFVENGGGTYVSTDPTIYNIAKGKTMIGGTQYDINLGAGMLPIGGRIFYVDPVNNGAVYKFFDKDGREITNQTVSGLANAAFYTVQGTPTKDKFYAYCTNDGTPTDSILVGSSLKWGGAGTTQGPTSDTIGSGKTNSATLVNKLGNTSGTIWHWIKNTLNQLLKNGCNDWFIGSKAEMERLRHSGTLGASPFYNYYLWSSVEDRKDYAYRWNNNSSTWGGAGKNSSYAAVALRSF